MPFTPQLLTNAVIFTRNFVRYGVLNLDAPLAAMQRYYRRREGSLARYNEFEQQGLPCFFANELKRQAKREAPPSVEISITKLHETRLALERFGTGVCNEQAAVVFLYLAKHDVLPLQMVTFYFHAGEPGKIADSHTAILVGSGDKQWVCDPWLGYAFPVSEWDDYSLDEYRMCYFEEMQVDFIFPGLAYCSESDLAQIMLVENELVSAKEKAEIEYQVRKAAAMEIRDACRVNHFSFIKSPPNVSDSTIKSINKVSPDFVKS